MAVSVSTAKASKRDRAVTSNAKELSQVRNAVLIATAVAWALLIATPIPALAHCTDMDHGSIFPPLTMLLAMNSPASLMIGWFLMLFAMMLPVLIAPLGHIRRTTFAHRRARSVALSRWS